MQVGRATGAALGELIAGVSPRAFYRVVAIAETITWTLLIVGMLLKYAFEVTDLGVAIGGFAHGLVFIAYGLSAALIGVNQRWRLALIVAAMATAVAPYATIPFDRWLERRGLLDGGWRLDVTDDPRDHTARARLLRWALGHPLLLGGGLVIALAAIMTTLLALGPPGGR